MQIILAGVKPYDGRYPLDFSQELTTREFGWIKRHSGYLPLQLDEAVEGGDPEFFCVLAAIALHRAGRITTRDVPEVFERLADAPFGSAIMVEVEASDVPEEDDADPPPRSSTESEPTSGIASLTNSETSPATPPDSGIPDSVTSLSDRLMLGT